MNTKPIINLLQLSSEAILSIDELHNISFFNKSAERMFGYTHDEALGENLSLLLPTRYQKDHRKNITEFGNSELVSKPMGLRDIALFGLRKDKSEFQIQVSISKGQYDSSHGYTAIIRDISKQVDIEEELRLRVDIRTHEIDRQKNLLEIRNERLSKISTTVAQLNTSLVKNLRQRLSLIAMPISNLKQSDINLSESTLHLINIAYREIETLNPLLTQFENYSLLETGGSGLQIEKQFFGSIIDNVYATVSGKIIQRGIDLEINNKTVNLELFIDRNIIVKCLIDVVAFVSENADENDRIMISVTEDKTGLVKIKISNPSRNLPIKLMEQIFDVLYIYQLPRGGFGVNLSITRYLIKLHGGSLDIVNFASGTDIEICLLKGRAHFTEAELVKKTNHNPPAESNKQIPVQLQNITNRKHDISARKTNVLVVDDQSDIRFLIKEILKGSYNVSTAINGQDALTQVRTKMPDLVISDIVMPVMDGIVFTRKMREEEDFKSIPIILLTANTASEVRFKGLRARADAYITKPVDSEELLILVRNLIDKRHQLVLRYSTKLADTLVGQIHLNGQDRNFLETVQQTILSNISHPGLCVNDLARAVYLSRRQLERRLKFLTGISPTKFINEMRLLTAKELLEKNALSTINEVATAVGFNGTGYFGRIFRKRFGISPSDILLRQNE